MVLLYVRQERSWTLFCALELDLGTEKLPVGVALCVCAADPASMEKKAMSPEVERFLGDGEMMMDCVIATILGSCNGY